MSDGRRRFLILGEKAVKVVATDTTVTYGYSPSRIECIGNFSEFGTLRGISETRKYEQNRVDYKDFIRISYSGSLTDNSSSFYTTKYSVNTTLNLYRILYNASTQYYYLGGSNSDQYGVMTAYVCKTI